MASKRGSHRHKNGHRSNFVDTDQDFSANSMDNGELNSWLSERLPHSKYPSRSNINTNPNMNMNSDIEVTLSKDIRNYFKMNEDSSRSSKDSWLSLPEIPTFEELSIDETAVPANKIDGPYKTKERYLKTQYALLREDALGCLRDALLDFQKDPSMMDTQKFSIYDQVHISGFTFSRKGLAARIKFSTNRAGSKISWSTTKRLTSGSLVALVRAKDCETMTDLSGVLTAIVAARPLAGVLNQPPEIDIYFARPEDVHLDPQEEWLMIEAKQGYFEAYRHTLQALKKLHKEKFPLSENICRLDAENGLPEYIQRQPILNLGAVAKNDQKDSYSRVDVSDPIKWPPAPNTLDESQWLAFREILTQKLAIIQGPPGTGKTHISTVAIQTLLENSSSQDPPIIIAAQTNHALDQLLIHIAQFCPDYIRLGGRSTNSEVKKRALFEIRRGEVIKVVPGGIMGKSNSQHEKQTKILLGILQPLASRPGSDPFCTADQTSPQVLRELGVLNDLQTKSLEDGVTNWVSADHTVNQPLQLWLDTSLVPFEFRYRDDNFGFPEIEDEDLEFEQLREGQEDSAGVNDMEDIEMLRGAWQEIHDTHTVKPAISNDLRKAEELLATENDLWRIPRHLRGPMYQIIRSRALGVIAARFREAMQRYNELVKDILIGKWEMDYVFLKRTRIIGMTTTGLSKYRALIAALKPRTILIEEAAEVLEAPVTVACVESLEHLILVGDHQQLRGHCAVSELENEPFFLNVSLFERLVRNNMPYKTLLCQRRMDPEFRRLLSSIYPALTDHPSVLSRSVSSTSWGMGTVKSFFFNHQWSEYKDASLSTYNEEEAKFIAGFYRYLQKNGIVPARITILTFYNGQRKRILREIKNLSDVTGTYHNVKTVDSYQGEENDIVILSMVRSNPEGSIGFLANDNRVTVALSRAKFGFYLFGNATVLCRGSKSGLWTNVANMMSASPVRLLEQLPLFCQKHKRTTNVAYPEHFEELEGGCLQDCGETLQCGHICPLRCHPYSHDDIMCSEPCQVVLGCGHGCEKACCEECNCPCDAFAEIKRAALVKSMEEMKVQWQGYRKDNHGWIPPANERSSYLQVQQQGRRGWSEFANGGVLADDQRRIDSTPLSLPQHTKMVQTSPLLEQTEGGRTRFTHNYRPELVEPTVAAEQHEVKQLQASSSQKAATKLDSEDVTTLDDAHGKQSARSRYLDDLAELDGGLKSANKIEAVRHSVEKTQDPPKRRSSVKSHLDYLAELDEGLKNSMVLQTAFARMQAPDRRRASGRSHLEDLAELDETMRNVANGAAMQNGLDMMTTPSDGTTRARPMNMDELLDRYYHKPRS
ncbi:hypothetical protein LTR84_008431 [Exophiala bonariae]|uniref:Helicase ATP-binding domain-containing protein n=1 Tax=Exophiala bonariae TaxID=1690606 RepID=A0AAV9N072_9EURO|nr:hypothetical protein LTR84_008431 [Exophiala bonariae]